MFSFREVWREITNIEKYKNCVFRILTLSLSLDVCHPSTLQHDLCHELALPHHWQLLLHVFSYTQHCIDSFIRTITSISQCVGVM